MATRETFTQQYMPLATSVGQRLQVDPNLLIAQWGLETGWGKSVIPGTNNLGNIKDFSGGGVAATDNMTGSRDKYLKFETPEAFGDHFVGLMNRKYPKVAGTGSDAEAFAQALRAGGYAEDPNYVNKIVSIATGKPMQPSAAPNVQGANMNTPYNQADPVSVYNFLQSQQSDAPIQQLTPEQKAALLEGRQRRASALPLAIGASLAGDKRVSALGNQMYQDARQAQGAMQLGDEGWLTSDGQLIQNPFTTAKREDARKDRLLQLAVSSANASGNRLLMDMLRNQQIQEAQRNNAPANLIPGENGQMVPDMNAPWRNLSNKQADTMRNQTMSNAQKQLADMREATQGDASTLQMMDQFLNLNKNEATGGIWDKFAPDVLKFGDTAAMLALQNKLTPLQRPAGSGATSDFEQRMYALGIPNIKNDYNVNQQVKLANEALIRTREARLRHYEQYLAKFGHLNGAEESFAPTVKEIEKEFTPKIEEFSSNKGKKSALPRATGQVRQQSPQVTGNPSAGGGLSPEEQRELQELRAWQSGRK